MPRWLRAVFSLRLFHAAVGNAVLASFRRQRAIGPAAASGKIFFESGNQAIAAPKSVARWSQRGRGHDAEKPQLSDRNQGPLRTQSIQAQPAFHPRVAPRASLSAAIAALDMQASTAASRRPRSSMPARLCEARRVESSVLPSSPCSGRGMLQGRWEQRAETANCALTRLQGAAGESPLC